MITAWAERPGARTFVHGQARAVAAPGLSRRDRLAVSGPPADAAQVVRTALAELGPTYRPIGTASLIAALVDAIPSLELITEFGWMWTSTPVSRFGGGWLAPSSFSEVSGLLNAHFPDSYAQPGVPGVARWAGSRSAEGTLAAVAADAWSSERIGFVAGVATDPAYRGRGHAAAACALIINDLLRDHEAVALIVDGWNTAAVALYHRLGMRYEAVAAARVK
ncbi:GNAT family N-acetyltransferase [Hamadaea sp.]|uniref:GNAT family N-acetyltransferase n=1 Tax=Hamadaea sp. TaxID=2024425 RepID=UPI0025C6D4F7|nr:GNAT family N-acetyltransferase [Hamadaea sp.]